MGRYTVLAKSVKQTDGLILRKWLRKGSWDLIIVFIILFILTFLLIHISTATPTITNFNNSISNNTIYPHINASQSIKFTVSANETISSWSWYSDGLTISNNYDNYTSSWNDGGSHEITVNGTNSNGTTQTIAWYVLVYRPKSGPGEVHTPLNTSWLDSLTQSIAGSSPDFSKFFLAIVLPFTNFLGDLFYIFVFGLPMIVIWLRQEKALVPAVLGIIFGGLIFGFIPQNWALPAILMMILTVFGIIYALFKER